MVTINLETWGYQGCGIFRATDTQLKKWVDDSRSGQRSKTARGTFALMSVALSHLEGERKASHSSFSAAFRNREKLNATITKTIYYNMRPDSNSKKNQDFKAIASVGGSDLGKLIWNEIQALQPHVIFVSGVAGLASLNRLLKLKKPIKFREGSVHPDGFVIQSIVHPSRASYAQWTSAVENVEQNQKRL